MNNEKICRMIVKLSLATVAAIVKRDNNIGTKGTLGVAAINKINSYRTSILKQEVDNYLKDKSVYLKRSGYLAPLGLDNTDYSNMPMLTEQGEVTIVSHLSNIVERDLNTVTKGIIPTVNGMYKSVEERLAELVPDTLTSTYNIKYLDSDDVLNSILAADRTLIESTGRKLDNVSLSLPKIDNVDTLKEYININPIINSAIDDIIDSKNEAYFIDGYNSVFGAINSSNVMLKNMYKNPIAYLDLLVVIYSIAKTYNNGIPFVVNGDKMSVTLAIKNLLGFLGYMLISVKNKIEDTIERDSMVLYVNENDIIIHRDSFTNSDLNIDTVIGAIISEEYNTEKIKSNTQKYLDVYIKVNELKARDDEMKRSKAISGILLSVLDKELEGVDYLRRDLSNEIYGLHVDKLARPKRVLLNLLLKYKYSDKGYNYIISLINRERKELSDDDIDIAEVNEFVVLRLIARILINNNLVIEDK